MADSLVSTGLRDLGYKYVVIDDCWQISRSGNGSIQADPIKFPSGIKALADYVHVKGLLFGIYSSAGTHTCQKRPGSLGYEEIDARQYASWGVDFLKYDNCNNKHQISKKDSFKRYEAMSKALNKTGRPIHYNMCNWGQARSWEWAGKIANSWRTTSDIGDSFASMSPFCLCFSQDCFLTRMNMGMTTCSVLNILDKQVGLDKYSGPGGFNDMDMLEVGNGGMTTTQYRTHFSFWAALKSPLILGNDISTMTARDLDIISNKEMIAINQDPLGKSAYLVKRTYRNFVIPDTDVWFGELSGGRYVALLFNRNPHRSQTINVLFKHLHPQISSAYIRSIWDSKDLGTFTDSLALKVAPHDTQVLLFTGVVLKPVTANVSQPGWNSWNLYECKINETIVRSIADSLVSTGLRDLGYKYVVVDDCWQVNRTNFGQIQADPVKFPSGIKALADYVHSKGLLFGIYSSAGTHTCQGRPGSLGYEEIDARQYADWGVDFLKYDNCMNNFQISREGSIKRYAAMRDALNHTNRPIYYYMCNWGQAHTWEWAADIANSWRTSADIGDLFSSYSSQCPCFGKNCLMVKLNIGPHKCSVTNILDKQVDITKHSGPGGFNDLDTLEIGNGGMNFYEYQTHFSLWSILKSNLILGNDVSNMTAADLSIVSNKELIEINQDPLGKSAKLVYRTFNYFGFVASKDIWFGDLSNDRYVVLFFNRDSKRKVDILLDFQKQLHWSAGITCEVRDVLAHVDLGESQDKFEVTNLEPHQSKVFVLSNCRSDSFQLKKLN